MTSNKSSSAETAQSIKTLLKELPEERADAARLDELRRLFAKLVATGELRFSTEPANEDTPADKWNACLQKRHATFVRQLCQRMHQRTAVRTMWGVIAASPMCSPSGHDRVHAQLMYLWMQSMTHVPVMDKSMRQMMEGEFLHPYRDVQYYALVAIARLANDLYAAQEKKQDDEEQERMAERLFQLLLMIPVPKSQEEMKESNYLFSASSGDVIADDEDDVSDDDDVSENESEEEGSESDESSVNDSKVQDEQQRTTGKRKREQRCFTFQQLKSHRKALLNAWLAVLKLPLPLPALKSALQVLPADVMPHVSNPLRFSDFFIQAYSQTGVVSLLALDGLFILMTQHGLEYPKFYESLYRLVRPDMLHVKYRSRFFDLLTKCLCRNEMLPAQLVASFCKRLLRSAQSAPPSAILFCLALVGNLLRKHPECAAMIHRGKGEAMEDPFDADTDDLTKTRALESSLWELSALCHHYYPAVVTLAKSIGNEDATTPFHDMQDFSRHTYKSLFDQERKRGQPTKKRRKVHTPLTFVEPQDLFTSDDVFSGMLRLPKK